MIDSLVSWLRSEFWDEFSPAQKIGLAFLTVVILAGIIINHLNNNRVFIPQTGEKTNTKNAGQQTHAQKSNKFVYVHVAGNVQKPGLYKLKDGSRVADAVIAAGGSLENGSLDGINLAQIAIDEMKIVVPEKEGEAAPLPAESRQGNGNLININSADESELDKLPGIGPSIAARIIDYREKNGPFKKIEQLNGVSGIGEKKFAEIKDKISLY